MSGESVPIFIDTEFYERGPDHPIKLISIGLVSLDGREYYAENSAIDLKNLSPWLNRNVVPFLTGPKKTTETIKNEILSFIGNNKPEIWGYFSDYDWVVFCQLFGTMIELPDYFPYFCLDLKQLMFHKRIQRHELPPQAGARHNALDDARWNRDVYRFIQDKKVSVWA